MDPASPASLAFGATTLLAGGGAVLFAVLALWLFILRRGLQKRLNSEIEAREQVELEAERLRPYAHVADAEEEATRLRHDSAIKAEQTIADAHTAADRIKENVIADVAAAQEEATTHRSEARAYAKDHREKAENALASASTQAARIVDQAREQAQQVAGDALTAMKKAQQWEATERAMRNIVTGYGDTYMKPPQSVLDDLADDYDHKAAGQELKLARARSKRMVTEARAATCDYVEKHRRDTAIRFVTDAFNGKVEALLSGVRTSNVGTLEQKITDAHAMVNHNGAAFRKARILPEYLEARLKELKWASAVLVLRDQEREEQREIKARLREEQRAQREFERAKRQAEKEEALLRKAMVKAQTKLGKAREEDRERFAAQLAELQAKLTEAEDRNQRAVSMAQLTRSGFVYIISNVGSFGEHIVKIGMTRRLEPLDRVRELGDSSVPFRFDVHALIYSADAPRLEKALHHRFALSQVNKANPRKEFFKIRIAEARAVVEELGLDVHWTMKAEALEYRETLVLNEALESDPEVRAAWVGRQTRWETYLESMGDEENGGEANVPPGGMPPDVRVAQA